MLKSVIFTVKNNLMLQKITKKEINQSEMSLVKRNLVIKITNTQPPFTCPKSTTETPEQGANHTHNRQ